MAKTRLALCGHRSQLQANVLEFLVACQESGWSSWCGNWAGTRERMKKQEGCRGAAIGKNLQLYFPGSLINTAPKDLVSKRGE